MIVQGDGLFGAYVHLLGIRFHLFTAALLIVTFFAAWFWLNNLVGASALVAFTVHFYETLHGSAEWLFTGVFTQTVVTLNVIVAVFCLLFMWRWRIITFRLFSTPILVGLFWALLMMGVTGFYSSLRYDLYWALSKVFASQFTLLQLRRPPS